MAHIRGSFFEDRLTLWRITIPKRLLVPFLIVLAAKIAGAVLVYNLLDIQNSGTAWFNVNPVFNWDQNTVFLQYANDGARWSYTFMGWDSAWYLSIVTRGYGFSPNSYAFFPGFSIFASLLTFLFRNPLVSGALCSFVFGVLWVPFFQLVAEKYLSKQAAFGATLLFAFSPYVFLFTTVVYSEGIFLFFTLSAWYLFKTDRTAIASGLAAVSALARVVGSVLVLPMLLVSVQKKGSLRTRWIAFSILPIAALISWLAYCQLTANDFLAFMHASEWSSLYTVRTLLFEGLPQKGFNVFQMALQNTSAPTNWLSPFAVVAALAVPPFLMYLVAKIDKPLALYSVACYVSILMFGALASMPRYVSVLFPLWIPIAAKLSMTKKTVVLLGVVSVVFFVVSLSIWVDFLKGQFVA
jgi:hypothetical protein